jgi:hypothetical protein
MASMHAHLDRAAVGSEALVLALIVDHDPITHIS